MTEDVNRPCVLMFLIGILLIALGTLLTFVGYGSCWPVFIVGIIMVVFGISTYVEVE